MPSETPVVLCSPGSWFPVDRLVESLGERSIDSVSVDVSSGFSGCHASDPSLIIVAEGEWKGLNGSLVGEVKNMFPDIPVLLVCPDLQKGFSIPGVDAVLTEVDVLGIVKTASDLLWKEAVKKKMPELRTSAKRLRKRLNGRFAASIRDCHESCVEMALNLESIHAGIGR